MQIAVLSGKGGTGKTFVSVNLAVTAGKSIYIDCDVEEPNGYLFLHPTLQNQQTVDVTVPEFDEGHCIGCRSCLKFCRFNALVFVKGKPKVFPELCHSCGGCSLICPAGAIRETKRTVGRIETGQSGTVTVITGILNQGEASGVPVIRQLLCQTPKAENVIVDCPPGSSCTVMESIKNADYCLFVAEPTLFGLENLKLVAKLADVFHKPHGIVINKDMGKENPLDQYLSEHEIPVLTRIPYDTALAKLNAKGKIAVKRESYQSIFLQLYNQIRSTGGIE
jgi:MinD superfamily P-loop ATPase